MNRWLLTWRIMSAIFIYFVVILPFQMLGWLILAVVLLFVPKEQNHLPKVFRWYDSLMGPKGDGIMGDKRYQDKQIAKGLDPKGYWAKYKWIAWRNMADYFRGAVLGFKLPQTRATEIIYQSPDGEKVGDWGIPGLNYLELNVNGKRRWEIYHVWVYKVPFTSKRLCSRLRIGYKMVGVRFYGKIKGRDGYYIQYAFSYNPIQPFRGTIP